MVHHPLSQFISEYFSTSWNVNSCTTATLFRCSCLHIWNKFIRIWDAKYFWSKYGQHSSVSSSLAGGNAFCWIATERPFTFVQHTLVFGVACDSCYAETNARMIPYFPSFSKPKFAFLLLRWGRWKWLLGRWIGNHPGIRFRIATVASDTKH